MSDWTGVRKVLCVRLDSLGDVLMSTPAIRALRESFRCRITLLTSPAGAAAAEHIPEVDDVIVHRAAWMKVEGASVAAEHALIERLRDQAYDAAAIFTVYTQSPLPAALACYLAGVPRRLAHCRENPYALLTDWAAETEPGNPVRHEVQRQLDLVASIGASTSELRLSFRVPSAARARVAALLGRSAALIRLREPPLLVVHPGASAASRRYPPEMYAEAIAALHARQPVRVVFTGDASEAPLIGTIRERLGFETRSFAGELSLAELGALIEAADLLLSNNTGPAHLAAALGTPVVDLYALTNPQHTPWRVASRVLFHDVPCRNCYRSVCPAGHHDCLRRVAPETVANAAMELLPAKKALAAQAAEALA